MDKRNIKFNKVKIEKFYDEVVNSYPEIKELYWGKFDDFAELIKNSMLEGDSVIVTCKNSEKIKFSQPLFDFLFKGNNFCGFDSPVGKRFEYRDEDTDYIFIELIESPFVTIDKKIERSGIFPIPKNKENDKIESCFFIKAENSEKDYYDYPEEIIPFFVSQMKGRFIRTFEDKLPSDFIAHFEPMKYVLKIKKDQENLLIKLLYKFGVHLGIVENDILKNNEISIKVAQEIENLLDENNNINFTNGPDDNLNLLKFYIAAITNPNPYYRFLDAYHIFESLFYKHFYNYVKNLNSNIKKEEIYNEIKNHVKEQQLLKLVLQNYLNDERLIREYKREIEDINPEKLSSAIGKNHNIREWSENNSEEFASKLSDFIYAFRNAIVHSQESNKHIEQVEKEKDLYKNFILLTNVILELSRNVLEKNIIEW